MGIQTYVQDSAFSSLGYIHRSKTAELYSHSVFNFLRTSLVAQTVKHLSTMWETRVRSLVGKIPWRRKWHPTPVLLPGKSHGQRSLVGYSPWGRKESDMNERLYLYQTVLYGQNFQKGDFQVSTFIRFLQCFFYIALQEICNNLHSIVVFVILFLQHVK